MCWSNHRGHQCSNWPSTVPGTKIWIKRSNTDLSVHLHTLARKWECRQSAVDQIGFLCEEKSTVWIFNSFLLNSSSLRHLVSTVFQVGSRWLNYDLMTRVARISPLRVFPFAYAIRYNRELPMAEEEESYRRECYEWFYIIAFSKWKD